MKASQIPDRTVIVYHYRRHICVPCHSPQQSAAGTLPDAGMRKGSLLSYLPRTIPGESVLPSVQSGSTAGWRAPRTGREQELSPRTLPLHLAGHQAERPVGCRGCAADLTAQCKQRSKQRFHIISGTHLNVRSFHFQVDWIPLWKILIQFISKEGKKPILSLPVLSALKL